MTCLTRTGSLTQDSHAPWGQDIAPRGWASALGDGLVPRKWAGDFRGVFALPAVHNKLDLD